ncbi:unnamed protein product [Boreogadus saida]
MVEKELGERDRGSDSLKSRFNCDMEEKGIVAVCGLGGRGSAAGGGAPPLVGSAYDREVGTTECRRDDMDPNCQLLGPAVPIKELVLAEPQSCSLRWVGDSANLLFRCYTLQVKL